MYARVATEFYVSMSAAAVGPRHAGTSPLARTAAWPRLHLHTNDDTASNRHRRLLCPEPATPIGMQR